MNQRAHSLFISDLHLCDSRPNITQAFIAFLQKTAIKAQALYILGDLFEYWPGDDAIDIGLHQSTIQALRNLSQQGVSTFLIHGNRDFLLGDSFAKAANITLLPDPSLLHLYGKPVLLSHGDALCTDDIAYQQFRHEVRSPAWQNQFLSQALNNRIAYIEQLRIKSTQEKSHKSMLIMDVNTDAVATLLRENAYPPLFIHGHTHRPYQHFIELDGHQCERWVLGDWYEQGSYLRLDADGCQSQQL
ncbi:UDP-2,3-diacylglucosamine diphosphatase [Methylotenera versatilis]|uniref:UDP-2,3-diacylglucosamine diphosphatase n=1 Tax=Methylotenera versatilis TaxID=1055487 RepID=UPI000646BD24|nr:UDP-2,3-diacylglucosamine diphosphatase [Methylotenera versatilis]